MSEANFDVDALLDGTLDDLADMPEFKPFPPGSYKVTTTMEDLTAPAKRVNGHAAIKLNMKIVEVLELADPAGAPPNPGDETGVLFFLDNDMGQASFKQVLKAAADKFGTKSNRELMSEMQNAECLVITNTRQNKEKTKTYTGIVEFGVA